MKDSTDEKRPVSDLPWGTLGRFAKLANGEWREEFEEMRQRNGQHLKEMLEYCKNQWLQEDRDRLCELAGIISDADGEVDDMNTVELRSLLCRGLDGQDPTTVRTVLAVVANSPAIQAQFGFDLSSIVVRFPIVNSEEPAPELVFSRDYRSCRWRGQPFEFTPTQAKVMKTLHEEWSQGTPSVSKYTLLDDIGSVTTELRDIFRNNHAFKSLIISGNTSGTWRLAPAPPRR